MRPISRPEHWAGEWPAVVVAAAGRDERRTLLRALAARMLDLSPNEVSISHGEGRAPRLTRPAGTRLYLSCAGRAGLAAMAVGRAPIGVDVEAVEPEAEPAWNVLHAEEQAFLCRLAPGERGGAFARLWACKEAYLKALGTGLAREPSSFAVLPGPDGSVCVRDAHAPAAGIALSAAWVAFEGRDFAVALAELGAASRRTGSRDAGMP
ncbi:4'-phosphopantetheinyl transferase family protein [Enterovirga aerilata]|uniref:4'-phosphopantetheinyl transferase superfamily protein n=1 Tax=Enterovirga aerilata TaxID=2730920 RepID=A0A849IB29_9HYPH|nr:4'-phosphopantetheinyl transferase superfamily protein [Enterovirga sp. DB1703]NNM74608.1 4'-phosphopantetheinyl transferase superfamily protein [Enterovirga sp. DB1703]